MAFLQCVSRDEKDEDSQESEEKFALELLIPRSDFRPKKILTSKGVVTAFWFNVRAIKIELKFHVINLI